MDESFEIDERERDRLRLLRGKGNVTDSMETEFYVIAPKNGTKIPFFERF